MGEIRTEPEPPVKAARCDGCGGTRRLAHGYVYDDDHAHGVYFIEWCDGDHDARAAFLALGLGAFGDGTGSGDRLSFGIVKR